MSELGPLLDHKPSPHGAGPEQRQQSRGAQGGVGQRPPSERGGARGGQGGIRRGPASSTSTFPLAQLREEDVLLPQKRKQVQEALRELGSPEPSIRCPGCCKEGGPPPRR